MNKLVIIGLLFLPIVSFGVFSVLPKNKPSQIEQSKKQVSLSNQWYSSIAAGLPTQPLFAFPLAFKITSDCLGVSYPTPRASLETVYASYQEDLCFSLPQAFSNLNPVITGDFHVNLTLSTSVGDSLAATIGHGLPFVTLKPTNPTPLKIATKIKAQFLNSDATILPEGEITTDTLLIQLDKKQYLLLLTTPARIKLTANAAEIFEYDYAVLALVDQPENRDVFMKLRRIDIQNTFVAYDLQNETLISKFTVETNGVAPLISIFPHQWQFLVSQPPVIGSYETLRGSLKLVNVSAFQTAISIIIPPVTFPQLASPPQELLDALKQDTKAFKDGPIPNSYDYFFGTWIGKGISLSQLANAIGLESEAKDLEAFIKPLLLERLQYFYYDDKLKSFIAKKPEFGNEKLSDHHFHYGYYIRAAAVLSQNDPGYFKQVEPIISEMVADIASHDTQNEKYPYLRMFDLYEGHSWADGAANFGDGNNQESSSEAINAWYGVYLWGKVSQNREIETTGLSLYNLEISSASCYWYNTCNVYPKEYEHAIASLVWGGKADFLTWFSPQVEMKYGIQLLPFTPASEYLGTLPNFASYEDDFLKSGGSIVNEWGNLFLMWKSFYEPKQAFLQRNQAIILEANHPRSMLLYYLYRNK